MKKVPKMLIIIKNIPMSIKVIAEPTNIHWSEKEIQIKVSKVRVLSTFIGLLRFILI